MAAAKRVSVAMEAASNMASALARAHDLAGSEDLVVITGSIYIVGEAMRQLGLRV